MQNLFKSVIVIFLIKSMLSCKDDVGKKNVQSKISIKYEKGVDTLETFPFMDSLFKEIDCDGDFVSDEEYLQAISDSVNCLYDQILVRLDSVKGDGRMRERAESFSTNLIKSKSFYDSLNNADQNMMFYSYGNATMQGQVARCYKIYLLRQRLFFLKAIFANAYWNYNFDSFR